MITAVDSSVLLDVLTAAPEFGPASLDALQRCAAEGSIVACDVVWAETSAAFATEQDAERELAALGVRFSGVDAHTAAAAGSAFRSYRKRGGPRDRVVADFLVGAHGQAQADRLLTRDRGFYRSYFSRLTIVDPTKP